MKPNNYFGQKGFPEMSQSPASTCSPENNSFSSREHCLLNDNQNQVFLSFQHWESLQIATEWLKPGSVQAGRLIQKKRLCLCSLEATACELACSTPFTLGADFYIFLKCCFIRMKTSNVTLLLQWYFHEGFCGKPGWAVALSHAQPSALPSGCCCHSRSVMGTVQNIKKRKKRQQKTMERDSDSPCWTLLSLPTENMKSKKYLALYSEVSNARAEWLCNTTLLLLTLTPKGPKSERVHKVRNKSAPR